MQAPARPGVSLRLSVTDRCQLRCGYCMPPGGVPLHDRTGVLSYEEITACVACLQRGLGLAKVRITGGEPLVRAQIERLVARLAGLGIPDLALTTNGLRLAGLAAALKRAGLDRVNVSLDSLRPATYSRLTGGGDLRPVLAGIDAALEAGLLPLKLNTVVLRGVNDGEVGDLVDFALGRGCELRFIELMPIGPGADLFAGGFVAAADVREALSARFELEPLPPEPGAAARRYRAADAAGRSGVLGFIAPCSAPFCADCARLRLTADGRLLGCLARSGGIPVRAMLNAGDADGVARAARRVLQGKRADHVFEQAMAMASIGG